MFSFAYKELSSGDNSHVYYQYFLLTCSVSLQRYTESVVHIVLFFVNTHRPGITQGKGHVEFQEAIASSNNVAQPSKFSVMTMFFFMKLKVHDIVLQRPTVYTKLYENRSVNF